VSEQSLPDVGDVYRHKGNGHEYRVTGTGLLEHPDTTEWVAAVSYTRADGKDFGATFARTMVRFLDRFEFVRRGSV
jgi:hypothetical protein